MGESAGVCVGGDGGGHTYSHITQASPAGTFWPFCSDLPLASLIRVLWLNGNSPHKGSKAQESRLCQAMRELESEGRVSFCCVTNSPKTQ